MLSILHVIPSLRVGGAETTLARLVQGSDPSRFRHHVVSLTELGPIGAELRDHGLDVTALDLGPGPKLPLGVARLGSQIAAQRPDVVHTWMYHANVLGGFAARATGVRTMIWSLHYSQGPPSGLKPSTRLALRAGAPLSRVWPTRVICCSSTAMAIHARQGYPADAMVLIPNGVEVPEVGDGAQAALRALLGLPLGTALVGRVGRIHPQKDLPTFLGAAALLAQSHPAAHFVLCGDGAEWGNPLLRRMIEEAGVGSRVHLLGVRRDVELVHGGLDVAVSSSAYGEAFPLVIVEALAAGTPVVATDVGDSADLVGDAGRIVAARDPRALAVAIAELLAMTSDQRRQLGLRGRARVAARFSVAAMVQRYSATYEQVAVAPRRPVRPRRLLAS